MPAILICTGLSSALQQDIECAIDEIAGPDNHYRYLSHPLRSVPLPLVPLLTDRTASLLDGHEDRFLAQGYSVVHQRNLLDEWVAAAKMLLDESSGGPIVLVVDAVCFKSYERWATSRGFPMQDIISNGRTLETQPQAPVFDIDLALQHLRKQEGASGYASCGDSPALPRMPSSSPSTPLACATQRTPISPFFVRDEYIIGMVGEDPVWLQDARRATSEDDSICAVLVREMRRQRASRCDDRHVVVTQPLHTQQGGTHEDAVREAKIFLVPAPEMQMLVDSVDAVHGNAAMLSTTLLGSLTKVLQPEQLIRLTLPGASTNGRGAALQEYVGNLSSSFQPLVEKVRTRYADVLTKSAHVPRAGLSRTRSYARVGLMGNPSDQLHGKSMAMSIENFWADVHIFESPTVRFIPNPITDPVEFGGLQDVFAVSSGDGYSGGLRLVQAICKRFFQYCRQKGVFSATSSWETKGFSIAYETNVPRQVGLAGSSCIVTAVLKALIIHFNVRVCPDEEVPTLAATAPTTPVIAREVLPSIALSAEMDELGIHAGLMDRVIQMYEGCVAMDFTNKALMEERGYAVYRSIDGRKLPRLHLAYAIDPSDSGRKHATVKQRWLNGDPEVHAAAKTWASLVDQLLECLDVENHNNESQSTAVRARLGDLMNANFDLRRTLYGDSSLGWKNLRMIEIARLHKAAAKFPGSGGAILIYCDPQLVNVWKLKKAMYAEGFVLVSLHNLS